MSGDGERRFFSGATLAQAVMAAARHYQIAPESLAYRAREKRHGFTHKQRSVVIEVDPAAPRRTTPSAPPAAAPARPSEPPRGSHATPPPRERQPRAERHEPRARERGAEAPAGRERRPRARREETTAAPALSAGPEHLEPGTAALRDLVRVAGLDLEVRASVHDDRLRLELDGPDADWLAGHGVEPLLALEHLVRRLLRSPEGALLTCEVDCRGLRLGRDDELRSLAAAAAAAVRKTGRAVVLDPMPAAARRVIHLTLADAPDLATESLGDGPERRLEIRLTRDE